jgi:hypothetical protein
MLAGALILALGLYAGTVVAAAPDILDIRPGMSPGDAYNVIRAFDSGHRVAIGQVQIPKLLGSKAAVYQMAPQTQDANNDNLYVNITLPPNPQQVWGVHRTLNRIHTTREQLVASLLQKYGSNYVSELYSLYTWAFTEQGQPANLSPADVKACEYRMAPVFAVNVPIIGPPGAAALVVSRPAVPQAFPTLSDPSQFPQCQNVVWVKAGITGADVNWTLDVDITYPGLQHRTTLALVSFFNNLTDKQHQQDLNKAEQTAVPKL